MRSIEEKPNSGAAPTGSLRLQGAMINPCLPLDLPLDITPALWAGVFYLSDGARGGNPRFDSMRSIEDKPHATQPQRGHCALKAQ